MTALITATFVFTALYISVALVARIHDCLMARRPNAPVLTVEVLEELSNELDTERAIATVAPEEITPAIELPNSIRGLRDYVRSNQLQARVKDITGKSVSSLNKSELHQAVTMAIA